MRDGEEALADGEMTDWLLGEVLKKGCDLAWKVLRKKVVIMQNVLKGGPLFGGRLWPCSIPHLHQTLPTRDPTSRKLHGQ